MVFLFYLMKQSFLINALQLYSKEHERAILFNDPSLNINWKVETPIVSEKDLKALLLKNIHKDFIY